MTRFGKPWFRQGSKGAGGSWYVTSTDGKQHRLCEGTKDGAGRDEADRLRARLLCAAEIREGQGDGGRRLIHEVWAAYAEDEAGKWSDRQWRRRLQFFAPFLAVFGPVPIGDVKPVDVERWLDGMRTWNDNTRAAAVKRLSVFAKWVRRCGILPRSFAEDVKRPRETPRGEECVVAPKVFDRLLAKAKPYMADILRFLWHTGCRPSECLGLRSDQVDLAAGVCVLANHKTAKKTGKPRIIVVAPQVRDQLAAAVAARPDGFVFVGPHGRPIGAVDFAERLRALRKAAGVAERVIPYSMRHSFATRLLEAGVSDVRVATLLGHSGTRELHRTYSHVLARLKAKAADYSDVFAALGQ